MCVCVCVVCMSYNTFAIQDRTFVNAADHLLRLVNEMRTSVNGSRRSLMDEMQGDEGAADCLIWRNASKEYKQQALELDDQMRELLMVAKVSHPHTCTNRFIFRLHIMLSLELIHVRFLLARFRNA